MSNNLFVFTSLGLVQAQSSAFYLKVAHRCLTKTLLALLAVKKATGNVFNTH